MWRKFTVTMQFHGKLCGSVPQSKELVRPWLEARMPKNKPADAEKGIEEIEAEVLESIEQLEEKTTLGFQKDDNGLFVRGATVKAHLKDCANQIKDHPEIKIKAFRSKVANKVYVDDYKIYLRNGKEIYQEPVDQFEQPVHVMTAQGPRNALKIINYVERPAMRFTLLLLPDKEVTLDKVKKIFEYGSVHGYGGERGMGEGRYSFEIMAPEK